jgi:hypothetical protein
MDLDEELFVIEFANVEPNRFRPKPGSRSLERTGLKIFPILEGLLGFFLSDGR